jgi:hypothetical protein
MSKGTSRMNKNMAQFDWVGGIDQISDKRQRNLLIILDTKQQ